MSVLTLQLEISAAFWCIRIPILFYFLTVWIPEKINVTSTSEIRIQTISWVAHTWSKSYLSIRRCYAPLKWHLWIVVCLRAQLLALSCSLRSHSPKATYTNCLLSLLQWWYASIPFIYKFSVTAYPCQGNRVRRWLQLALPKRQGQTTNNHSHQLYFLGLMCQFFLCLFVYFLSFLIISFKKCNIAYLWCSNQLKAFSLKSRQQLRAWKCSALCYQWVHVSSVWGKFNRTLD